MSKILTNTKQIRKDVRAVRLHLNEVGRNAFAEYMELLVRWECLLKDAVHKITRIEHK
jgi:hypothetical protein